jgi:hypothetical protein
MDAKARRALSIIRKCVAADRFILLAHFTERMNYRGLVWPDIRAVLESPKDMRPGGKERYGRPKWIVSGTAADGLGIEIVCVLDQEELGNLTVFITY